MRRNCFYSLCHLWQLTFKSKHKRHETEVKMPQQILNLLEPGSWTLLIESTEKWTKFATHTPIDSCLRTIFSSVLSLLKFTFCASESVRRPLPACVVAFELGAKCFVVKLILTPCRFLFFSRTCSIWYGTSNFQTVFLLMRLEATKWKRASNCLPCNLQAFQTFQIHSSSYY